MVLAGPARECLGCGDSLEGTHGARRWCMHCGRIRHFEQMIARQRERYRTDPVYRAKKRARTLAMRERQRAEAS